MRFLLVFALIFFQGYTAFAFSDSQQHKYKPGKGRTIKELRQSVLKLFPNFVEEFNALFKEEDQIRLNG